MIEIATSKVGEENKKSKYSRHAKNGWYRYDTRFALPVYAESGEIERYNKTLHYSTSLLDYAIIHNSEVIISEKGYDGVGVDLIAENAGLKGPSLYRHYKGKEVKKEGGIMIKNNRLINLP